MEHRPKKGVVVISGASGYLGGAVSSLLMEKGFKVLNVGVDITNSKAVKEYSRKVIKLHGQIYCIIHAASAPLIRKPVLSLNNRDFMSQFSVNVTGAYHLFRNLLPALVPGGVIIGITTSAIESGTPHTSSGSYVAAKYALRGLLRIISNEFKDRPVRVYALSPAFMLGGLNNKLPPKVKELIVRMSTRDNMTNPAEAAGILLKLISDTKGLLSGKSITVPGQIVTDL